MNLPFTTTQFFEVFSAYNTAIWPAQVVAYLLAGVVVLLVFQGNPFAGRVASAVLAVFWVWMGVVYHIMYFSPVNPAALVFGVLFAAQGLLFLAHGTVRARMPLAYENRPVPMIGAFFVVFALAVYPLLGSLFGHRYPSAPVFGVAPCPTTIFTFGVLLWSTSRVPTILLVVPFLWSLVGMSAAISLRVPQDYGLVVAGVVGATLVFARNRGAAPPRRA